MGVPETEEKSVFEVKPNIGENPAGEMGAPADRSRRYIQLEYHQQLDLATVFALRRRWSDRLDCEGARYVTKRNDPNPERTAMEMLLSLSKMGEVAPMVKRATVWGPGGASDMTGFAYADACEGREDWVLDPIKKGFDPGNVFSVYVGAKPTRFEDLTAYEQAKNSDELFAVNADAVDKFLSPILKRRFEHSPENAVLRKTDPYEVLNRMGYDEYWVQVYSVRAVRQIRADLVSIIAQLDFVVETGGVDGEKAWAEGRFQGFNGLDESLRPKLCSPWDIEPYWRCTVGQALSFYQWFDRILSFILREIDPDTQCVYFDGP